MSQIEETSSPILSEAERRTLREHLAGTLVSSLMPHSDALREVQAQFAQYAKTFAVALDELNRRFQPFLVETLPFVQKLVETDWTAVLSDHEKSFLYMAECGWTLPDWIDLGDLRTLHLKAPEELDRYFVEGFMADGAENLKELGISLKGMPGLSQWHPLIDDIIASIEAGRHRVAIPATLTIMDGYLAGALVKASLATPKITSPFKVLRDARWHEDDTFDAVFWKAGVVFLSRVFAPSDFTQQPPTFINRHWILHGRAPVDWTLSDALRLVNSLTTLEFLFVTVGQPKPNAPKWHGDPNDGFSITRKVQEPTQ
jgi:hypothetical protein